MKKCALLLCTLASLSWSTACFSQHVPAGAGDGEQFLWPVDAWVAADETYASGDLHSGTADLSAPHYTPIRPARSGVVESVRWANVGGWIVDISHDGSVYNYTTTYTHLIERPLVDVGDSVDALAGGGTLLGYVGRLGNADVGGPHVHFSIRREPVGGGATELLSIPAIDKGDWVSSGKYIPGVFTGLTPIGGEALRTFEVSVREPSIARLYSSSALSSSIATVAYGTDLEVFETHNGAYRVLLPDDSTGWIMHSATVPARSNLFNLTRASDIIIRRTPSTALAQIGVVPGGTLLTGFDLADNGWHLVQWRCNATSNRSADSADNRLELGGCPNGVSGNKYGWVGSIVPMTHLFHARTRRPSMSIYANQVVGGEDMRNLSSIIGTLSLGARVTVTGTRNGWYRFTHAGQTAWIRGWQTAGPQ
ncbi:SH3 domain-containing protein [Luteimonas sp. SDU101]|uniref:SH3 domain-containing protein n=1 Tax=unclassified Luteimonas TaxID=2629088 RepID=UPI003EBCDD42